MPLIHILIPHEVPRLQHRFHTALMQTVTPIITGHGFTQSDVPVHKRRYFLHHTGIRLHQEHLNSTTANYLRYLGELPPLQAGPTSSRTMRLEPKTSYVWHPYTISFGLKLRKPPLTHPPIFRPEHTIAHPHHVTMQRVRPLTSRAHNCL